MDILLVNPHQHESLNNMPWGVLAVGSYLRSRGFAVELIDASLDGEAAALDEIAARLDRTPVVALGCMSSDAPFLIDVADLVKARRPDCKVLVGGSHANLCPEQTCAYPNIDFVAYGEGELTSERLLQELAREAPDFEAVPGLIYRQGETIRRTGPAEPAPFYDLDYALLDERVQAGFGRFMEVLAGRGCSFKCTFCYNVVTGQKWRGRDPAHLMAEVERLVAQYDPQVIFFRDDLFFHDRNRIPEFVRLYREKGFRFRWWASCRAADFRPDYINDQMLADLASINCVQLRFGVESGSERVLKYIKKGIRLAHVHTATRRLAEHPSIRMSCGFILGFPTETAAEYQATMDLAWWIHRTNPGALVKGPYLYRVYPGGELYEEVLRDYPFTAPDSLMAWAERYRTMSGLEDRLDYPWIPPGQELLAHKGFALLSLARWNARQGDRPPEPWRRALMYPFVLLARLRFATGFYRGLWDLKAALAIQHYSTWRMLGESTLFARLEKTALYAAFRRTMLFGMLRRMLT